MTHAELLATSPHPGVPPSACPGELADAGRYDDVAYSEAGPRARVVFVHRCTACGARISESEGVVLNSYHPPPYKDLARRLAGEIEGRKGGFLP